MKGGQNTSQTMPIGGGWNTGGSSSWGTFDPNSIMQMLNSFGGGWQSGVTQAPTGTPPPPYQNSGFQAPPAYQNPYQTRPTAAPGVRPTLGNYPQSIDYESMWTGMQGNPNQERAVAQALLNSPDPWQAAVAAQMYAKIFPDMRPNNAQTNYISQAYNPATNNAYLQPTELSALGTAIKPGMTAQQIQSLLPAHLQTTASPAQIAAANTALRDAERAYYASQITPTGRGPGDPALQAAYQQARNVAYQTAYGPLGHNFAQGTVGLPTQAFNLNGRTIAPNPSDPTQWLNPDGTPLLKQEPVFRARLNEYQKNIKHAPAYKYGYGTGGEHATNLNIQQTLRSAGWNPTTGAKPVGRTPAQQQMLNELAMTQTRSARSAAARPTGFRPAGAPSGSGGPARDFVPAGYSSLTKATGARAGQSIYPSGGSRGGGGTPDIEPQPTDPRLVAHVQNTLGGNYYGGIIPRQSTALPPNPWATLKSMGFAVPKGVDLSQPTITGQQMQGLGSSPWGGWQSYNFSPWPGIMGR